MERKREKKEGGGRKKERRMLEKECVEKQMFDLVKTKQNKNKNDPLICLAHTQLVFLYSKNLKSICYCEIQPATRKYFYFSGGTLVLL